MPLTPRDTPLHLAVTFKPADPEEVVTLSEMLLLLLEMGADPKLPNKNGQTPLHSCQTDEARRILSGKRGLSAMNVDVGDVRRPFEMLTHYNFVKLFLSPQSRNERSTYFRVQCSSCVYYKYVTLVCPSLSA